MIDRINAESRRSPDHHRRPHEFLHRDKKSFINQREVEVTPANFSTRCAPLFVRTRM